MKFLVFVVLIQVFLTIVALTILNPDNLATRVLKKVSYPIYFILVIRAFVLEPNMVPTNSMSPTINPGDYTVGYRVSYNVRNPITNNVWAATKEAKRGDIATFKTSEDSERLYAKRVIGLPGDVVQYSTKSIYVNGEKIAGGAVDDLSTLERVEVPKGEYFMAGDNTDESADSRYFGTIPHELLHSEVFAVWMNVDRNFPDFSAARFIQ